MKQKYFIFLVYSVFMFTQLIAQEEKTLLNKEYASFNERAKYEINVSHILIKYNELDSLEAFKTAENIRTRIINGESFEVVAKEVSQDPSVKKNGGNLGWFTVLKLVLPFEIAAYSLDIGEISLPVYTSFGYHIIKLNDKQLDRGKVKVAQIMIKIPKNATPDTISLKKDKIDEVFLKLKNGKDFADLAKEYSEDKSSALKGGELRMFSTGQMIDEFEDVSFALEELGQYSIPFKTDFGWHIVKLIARENNEIPSFERFVYHKSKFGEISDCINYLSLFPDGEYSAEIIKLKEVKIASKKQIEEKRLAEIERKKQAELDRIVKEKQAEKDRLAEIERKKQAELDKIAKEKQAEKDRLTAIEYEKWRIEYLKNGVEKKVSWTIEVSYKTSSNGILGDAIMGAIGGLYTTYKFKYIAVIESVIGENVKVIISNIVLEQPSYGSSNYIKYRDYAKEKEFENLGKTRVKEFNEVDVE